MSEGKPFKKCIFFIVGPDDGGKIKDSIEKLGGRVLKKFSASVQYIIFDENGDEKKLEEVKDKGIVILKREWISESQKRNKIVDIAPFEVKLGEEKKKAAPKNKKQKESNEDEEQLQDDTEEEESPKKKGKSAKKGNTSKKKSNGTGKPQAKKSKKEKSTSDDEEEEKNDDIYDLEDKDSEGETEKKKSPKKKSKPANKSDDESDGSNISDADDIDLTSSTKMENPKDEKEEETKSVKEDEEVKKTTKKQKSGTKEEKKQTKRKSVSDDEQEDVEEEEKPKKLRVMITGMHTKEKEEVEALKKKLPNFTFTKKLGNSVTHIVVGKDLLRTLKVLRGIALGKWIVTVEWLKACAQKNSIVDEKEFEVHKYHGCARARKDKKVFAGMSFFVYGETQPPKKDLEKIITDAGGQLTNATSAKIAIKGSKIKGDPFTDKTSATILVPEYVLDCVSSWKLLDQQEYKCK